MTNFFHDQKSWDKAYAMGEWDYLSRDTSELSRQALVAGLLSIYSKSNGYSVLDLGCGLGTICRFISKETHYLGVDISNSAVLSAKHEFPDRNFLQASVGSNSFNQTLMGDKSFDFIILNELLYYLDSEEMTNLSSLLTYATKAWNNPVIIASICRSDAQNLHHGSYYWSLLFSLLNHDISLEIADTKHRWDIRTFKGLRLPD